MIQFWNTEHIWHMSKKKALLNKEKNPNKQKKKNNQSEKATYKLVSHKLGKAFNRSRCLFKNIKFDEVTLLRPFQSRFIFNVASLNRG